METNDEESTEQFTGDNVDVPGPSSQSFKCDSQCFICEKKQNKTMKIKLTKVSKAGNDNLRKKLIVAAKIKKDDVVLRRLSIEKDLFSRSAHYHATCYQNYTSKRALDAITRSEAQIPMHENVAEQTLEVHRGELEGGALILFSVLCTTFREILARETNLSDEVQPLTKSAWIKLKIQKVAGDSLRFYSHPGKSDIVCSTSVSIGGLLHELIQSRKVNDSREEPDRLQEVAVPVEVTLHKAAAILSTHCQRKSL